MSAEAPLAPRPLTDALAAIEGAPLALLGLGIPRCPASELLAASLPAVGRARPELAVVFTLLEHSDWALRPTLLWPRGIRVSRSSVPSLSLLRDGTSVAHRLGGGPATAIDDWLSTLLGPAENPMTQGLTETERQSLASRSGRSAQHVAIKGALEPDR